MSNNEEYTKVWLSDYEKNFHPWHISGVNPYLMDFFTVMMHGEKINGKQILIPLCGKSSFMRRVFQLWVLKSLKLLSIPFFKKMASAIV